VVYFSWISQRKIVSTHIHSVPHVTQCDFFLLLFDLTMQHSGGAFQLDQLVKFLSKKNKNAFSSFCPMLILATHMAARK